VCLNYKTYVQHLQQIQTIACTRAVFGVNRIWLFRDMNLRAQEEKELRLSKTILRLAQDYKNKLYLSYQNTLAELEAHVTAMNTTPFSDRLRREIEDFVRIVFGFTLQGPVGEGWIRQWKDQGDSLLRSGREPVTQDLINQVLSYIDLHYKSNIGLSQMASEMNVTTSYLSTLFHKKTGTTFIKYLTRLRILQAKELLCHTNMQIQQVAEHVGYYSARHFTKLFVDMVGVYPSEFKKRICQPDQDPSREK
jgi:two-component system response regulator YesN